MSYLFPRNIGGFSSIESLLVNELQIQSQGSGGLIVYRDDPTEPLFSINGETGTITTSGTLEVLGTAVFNTIDIQELKNGLLQLASENETSDTVDVGFYGEYNQGAGIKFTALFRHAADPDKRWFFIENFDGTPPLSNIPAFTSSNFSGVVAHSLFTNIGTVTNPAYTFYSDPNTGIYSPSNDSVAVAVGGLNGFMVTNIASTIEVKLNTSSLLYYSATATTNDIASSQGGVTTGSLLLQSSGTADKWQRYISTNPVSAYAGINYSFGLSNHYFITNSNGSLVYSLSTQTLGTLTQTPDYRNGSRINLLTLNSVNLIPAVPVLSSHVGSTSSPSYSFSTSSASGMYMTNSSTLSFTVQNNNIIDIINNIYIKLLKKNNIFDNIISKIIDSKKKMIYLIDYRKFILNDNKYYRFYMKKKIII